MRQAVHRSKQEKPNIVGRLTLLFRYIIFAALAVIAGILLVSLLTHHPEDPAWSSALQSENIENWLGKQGALFSDIAFTALGKVAYLFPLLILAYGYQLFINGKIKQINIEVIIIRLFGILLLIFSSSGLFDIINSSGGAIGKWIGSEFTMVALSWFANIINNPAAVITASKIFLSILTLIALIMTTGRSPLYWFEYTGKLIFSFFTFCAFSKKKIKNLPPIEIHMKKDRNPIPFLKRLFDRTKTLKKGDQKNNFTPIDVAEFLKAVDGKNHPQKENMDVEEAIKRPTITKREDQFFSSNQFPIDKEARVSSPQRDISIMNDDYDDEQMKSFHNPKITSKILDLNSWANAGEGETKAEPAFTDKPTTPRFVAIDNDDEFNSWKEAQLSSPKEQNDLSADSPNQSITDSIPNKTPNLSFGQAAYRIDQFSTLNDSKERPSTFKENVGKTENETPINQRSPFSFGLSSPNRKDDKPLQFNSSLEDNLDDDDSLYDDEAFHTIPSFSPDIDEEIINPSSSFSFTHSSNRKEEPQEPSFNFQNKPKVEAEPLAPSQGYEIDIRSGMPIPQKPKKVFQNLNALPSPNLLGDPPPSSNSYNEVELTEMAAQIEEQLKHFNVEVTVAHIDPGPVITRFELDLAPGVKVAQINNLSKDIARALSVTSVRVVDIIPGKPYVGLEIPNSNRETVYFKEGLFSPEYREATHPLTLILGKDISGRHVTANLGKMPHLLVAGTTGSGKSVGINTMLLSLLFKARPDELRLILIDPKMLELSVYNDIPHLLAPVVTDMKESANALRWCVAEMERRYLLMSSLKVRNIAGYNKKIKDSIADDEPLFDPTWLRENQVSDYAEPPMLEPLPYIVVVIDEFADMMMLVGKKCEELIARLAQKARASGIHLILATQRPSVDVITGLIKANIPTRISFQVSSRIDSRTIIDQQGAETLLGHGDMLYLPPGNPLPIRVHGAFIDDHEVNRIVEFLKTTGDTDYIEDILKDPTEPIPGLSEKAAGVAAAPDDSNDALFDEAVRIVVEDRRASISYVQRRLRVGYQRAARLIEEMERQGFISAPEANGSREVLIAKYVAEPEIEDE